MPTIFVSANTTNPQVLNSFDRIYVPTGIWVVTDFANAVQGPANSYGQAAMVDGSVVSTVSAILLGAEPSGFGSHAIAVGATGLVRSLTAFAVSLTGKSNTILNSGQIVGYGGGIRLDLASDSRVTNSGSILGDAGQGIHVLGSNNVEIINSGRIAGVHGIDFQGSYGRILNSGELVSNNALGRAFLAWSATGDIVFRNTGSVEGLSGAMDFGAFDDTLVNAGRVVGDVLLGAGGDTYEGNGGNVFGDVYGGAGIDQMRGGEGIDRFFGDVDTDILHGRAGDDLLDGGAGNDQVYGGTGDDAASGSDGFDLVYGGAGAESVNGWNDSDLVFGDAGTDLVTGDDGRDTLDGGGDNDTIVGGAERDILFGGRGADTFVYYQLGDSLLGNLSDAIRDFETGADVIDLDAMSVGDLLFQGTAAFAGGGAGSVRYLVNAGGNAVVLIDADGNGAEDMRIVVQNTAVLAAGDFVL